MEKPKTPRHIAVIMDGNRRWAKAKGLPVVMGHRAGIDSITQMIKNCLELGISILTIYAFSTENWSRSKQEVNALMSYIREYIDREMDSFQKNGVRLNCLGRLEGLPEPVRDKLKEAMDQTRKNSKLIFNVAINYGSRSEIVDAVKKIIDKGENNIDEQNFGDYLYTKGMIDPDLVIRTSGEERLSNFLLWQASYSELYFTDVLWPDFKRKNLTDAIAVYQKRQRRFGE